VRLTRLIRPAQVPGLIFLEFGYSLTKVEVWDAGEDYDGAEKMYRKAIELAPSHARTHFNLGVLLWDAGEDYDGAEKMYRKAIDPARTGVAACRGPRGAPTRKLLRSRRPPGNHGET